MTREETKLLLARIGAEFSNWNPKDNLATLESWADDFYDIDASIVYNALKKYIRTSGSAYAPTASQLFALIANDSIKHLCDGEIHSLIVKASKNANYGAVDEYLNMPSDLQEAIGSASVIQTWGAMDSGDLANECSRIIKRYKEIVERKKKDSITPKGLNLNINCGFISDNNLSMQLLNQKKQQL